uniref:SOWAHA-C winged helix-turn-helix domain-containing protein n=1 Tax=Sphaeramia orbicularis TaxID=375764 RepID=A0A673BBL5_9TELE
MGDVSEESLLDYFYCTGGNSGRVRNAEILKTFKPFIGHSDLQLRGKGLCGYGYFLCAHCSCPLQGEKYLVLKKKYRQLLQDRDTKHHGAEGEGQRHSTPVRTPATVQWEATEASTTSSNQKEHQDEPMSCTEPEGAATESTDHSQEVKLKSHFILLCSILLCSLETEVKSQTNWDESPTTLGAKMQSLDPIEKEWIYSAAGARVPDLSQLLRQDPSLANKKVTALHWAAKHGNEDMANLVANAGADVNTKSVSGYTPLHIAALHGHQHILDLLVGTYGAKENLRDHSGHLACHYLTIKEPEAPEEDFTQARERNRNRKLVSLFHSKKKWGSAEELAPIEEERTASHQLALPAFRPRKFSR